MNPAQDRPGSLFVCENTVELMFWSPPLAAQNLRRINKEKAFTPLGLKKRLHRVVSLTGMDFQKQGRGDFFLLPEFLHESSEKEHDILSEKCQRVSKNQTRPCVALCAVLEAG